MFFLLIYLVGTVIERLSQPAEILATLTCSFVSLKSLPFFNCFFFLIFLAKSVSYKLRSERLSNFSSWKQQDLKFFWIAIPSS